MIAAYKTFKQPLSHKTLYQWHTLVMEGSDNIETKSAYRKHTEPMQITSGNYTNPKIYFVAPPSDIAKQEMDYFINWHNQNQNKMSTLIRAGIAH